MNDRNRHSRRNVPFCWFLILRAHPATPMSALWPHQCTQGFCVCWWCGTICTGRASLSSTGSQVLIAALVAAIWPLPQYVQGTKHLPTVASRGGTCFLFWCRGAIMLQALIFCSVSKMRVPKTCWDNNFRSELCSHLNGCVWETSSVMSLFTAQQLGSNLLLYARKYRKQFLKKKK